LVGLPRCHPNIHWLDWSWYSGEGGGSVVDIVIINKETNLIAAQVQKKLLKQTILIVLNAV